MMIMGKEERRSDHQSQDHDEADIESKIQQRRVPWGSSESKGGRVWEEPQRRGLPQEESLGMAVSAVRRFRACEAGR